MSLPSRFEPDYFFRSMFALNGMDRESAVWQLTNMYTNPAAVRRMITAHKHAKGRWSRDDPAFLLLEMGLIASTALVWYILPITPFSLATLVRGLFTLVGFDFLFLGVIFATCLWFSLNRWGKTAVTAHHSTEDVEWRYCFDVYCNSFIAIIVDIDLGFVLVMILSHLSNRWFFRVLLPNAVIFAGCLHFVFLAVPFTLVIPYVNKVGIMPFVVPLLVALLISLIFSIEGGTHWLHFHFSC